MSSKQPNGRTGGAAGAPAPAEPGGIRNVALVGPSGSGKTTLVEALLATNATIARPGSVVEGSTVCDYEPAATQQQRSVGMAVAPVQYGDLKINFIDTPGYADFIGEMRAGLRAADAALFVLAGAEGVNAASRAMWHECAEVGMPRAVLIARLDQAQADFDAALEACQGVFGDGVLPLYLPQRDAAGEHTGLRGLITETVSGRAESLPDIAPERVEHYRGQLIEAIISESEDESLMDRYLAGEEVDEDTLITDLERAVTRGGLFPVLPTCSATGLGLEEILDGIARGFPSPPERPIPDAVELRTDTARTLDTDPSGPLVAEVVHTSADAYVGRVSLVRVFSGSLHPDTEITIAGQGMAERGHEDHAGEDRVSHVYSPLGSRLRPVPRCVAGDVCALTKLTGAETGDTLSAPADPLLVRPWAMPEPLLPIAVIGRGRGDEDALARNLNRLVAADPTLRLERDAETHQLVLWCMGEAHADVVLQRLRDGGATVDTEPVRVPLRQTFAAATSGHGRHVKQSGGHGQYAVCDVEVEPLPRGSGVEFAERIVGGVVPRQYIPGVEKGVRAQLGKGLADRWCPIVDVRVTLVDGKSHSVDSSDAAFQAAGALAIKAAAEKAGLITLEPVDEVEVHLPDEHLGAILGDLSSRRGRVMGTEPEEPGWTVVRAHVPASELVRYAVNVRSLSSGSARFTRRFEGYEPMPESLTRQD
ncbi:elongation factor G-like protein EF-G2 [Salinifilum aidingensis]